ncbi:enoyl-CoA hydratase/isomerase family protein [Marivita sp.]|jgi:enoyl-CoA hydratase/carnithine racemase|uniref:enoyl-CoA hydratase/isomerase family protein n=1 Tax=Marivita sp. TaxID=2003365 RepID=UPI00321AB518
MSFVTIEKQGRAGIIGLNRPKAMNALTLEMILGISDALNVFEADDSVRLVVLRSDNEQAFCAGGDMRRIRDLSVAENYEEAEQFFQEEYALIARIAGTSKPFIPLIDGACMGGGMGLAMQGSHRIATERATFAMPETAIGFFPDVGGSYFLPRMPHHAGYWMGLTGARVRGFDAHGLGISTHMTVCESLPALFDELCHSDRPVENLLSFHCASLGYQPSILMLAGATSCFDQPTLCCITECLKRYQGPETKAALIALGKASARSLVETMTLLKNGAEQSLKWCLTQEYEAMRRAIRHPDLAEGVRAVLVDKDHMPRWTNNTAETILNNSLRRQPAA